MLKNNIHWYTYWLICIVIGLLIGGVIGTFSSYPTVSGPTLLNPSPSISAIVPAPSNAPTTILFVGDVMLGRSVNKNIALNNDPSWPYIYVQDVLRSADITYINLESPLTYNCPIIDTGMKFCGDIGNVAGLISSGIDIASVANNHTLNYGPEGLRSTVSILSSNNIKPVGLGDAVTLPRGRVQYVFLSYNDIGQFPGIAPADPAGIVSQIKQIKNPDNLVIVTFHWGSEYRATPNNRQVELAHMSIDAGADLVIGAHPHWVQTKEIYKDKPIYYSLGNFIFDQEWSPETKRGLAVRFTYDGLKLIKTEELPVYIDNYGQAHWQ